MLYDKLIIDANLLLLLVIGSIDDGIHIKKSGRLKSNYDFEDYDALIEVMNKTKEIYITPYIATEVSNLIDLKGNLRKRIFEVYREILNSFKQVEVDIHKDIKDASFIHYGLADASLVNLASEYKILTADDKLLTELFKSCYENILPYKELRQS